MTGIQKYIIFTLIFLFFHVPFSFCQEEKSRDLNLSIPANINKNNSPISFDYPNSFAMIVGINRYEKSPWDTKPLDYASKDAIDLAKLLQEKFDFKKENIFLLLDKKSIDDLNRTNSANLAGEIKEATLNNIKSIFNRLGDPSVVGNKDRILMFFAGHGHTIELPTQGEMGFIIPSDGGGNKLMDYDYTTLSMDEIRRKSSMLPAKHVLYLVDACYSGLATERGLDKSEYVEKVFPLTARQIITAGGKDETVIEKGEWGHSAFSYSLLQGLKTGFADTNQDGFITATELANYLAPEVTNLTHKRQTPQAGRFLDERGEFTFALNTQAAKKNDVPKYGFLTINVEPWGTIAIDGESKGDSPLVNEQLLIGEHLITIQKSEFYTPVTRKIVVEEGRTAVLSVSLEKK